MSALFDDFTVFHHYYPICILDSTQTYITINYYINIFWPEYIQNSYGELSQPLCVLSLSDRELLEPNLRFHYLTKK